MDADFGVDRLGIETQPTSSANCLVIRLEKSKTDFSQAQTARFIRFSYYAELNGQATRFAQKGGVIVFRLEGIMANRVAKELAEWGGIGVRSGCHCAHLLIKRLLNINPLLARMQGLILILFPQIMLPGLVRVSLGIENSAEDVDTLIHVLGKIARQPRAGVDRHFASTHNGTPILPQTDVQQQMDDFARAAAQRVYTQLK